MLFFLKTLCSIAAVIALRESLVVFAQNVLSQEIMRYTCEWVIT